MATGTLAKADREKVNALQFSAWGFYGWPGSVTASTEANYSRATSSVGEVRYVVGWMADQMSRMDWAVAVNGSLTWTLQAGGETIRSDEEAETDEETHPRRASYRLLSAAIGWSSSVVRQITTNLFVAGELDYTADATGRWTVVSVIHPDRRDLLEAARLHARGLWPHPADPSRPDAPLFGVLDVLEELVWLSKLARSQSRNRVGMRGILGVADGLSFANGGEFWTEWESSMGTPMRDTDNLQPVILRGATELVQPSGSGMTGLSWLVPQYPYDDKVDARIAAAIQRLAYGLPTPPEILLGMQAQSRATAFQVEENSYRAHIEPGADLVAALATDALAQVVDGTEVVVLPDPTALLARRHTVSDALEAFDRGAVSYDYLREALAIPPDAEPTSADIELLLAVKGQTPVPVSDPGTDAAEEAVTASVGGPADDPLTSAELDELSDELATIDATLLTELGGATQQATERARERVGAKTRTRPELRSEVPSDVPNEEVAAYLGLQVLSDQGVPVAEVVEQALGGLTRWWTTRVEQAQSQVTQLLGEEADPRFTQRDVTSSVEYLRSAMVEHVLATLESPLSQALPADERQRVISVAGGADA